MKPPRRLIGVISISEEPSGCNFSVEMYPETHYLNEKLICFVELQWHFLNDVF
jgi:hypothetical protein